MSAEASTAQTATLESAGLQQTLKERHLSLISLGGAIGAGLFVGSGVIINAAGPASIISFAIAGIIVIFVVRMLGEMVTALPVVGSFYEYARLAFGNGLGFTVGWLYWYFWVIVVAVEAVAGGNIVRSYLPDIPLWVVALALLLLLTATNLVSTRSYGEFESWFSLVKVAAIVVFILCGLGFILGVFPGHAGGISNLVAHGGFAPHGWAPVLAKAAPAVAFFVGVEIVTIAAVESKEPVKTVAKATSSVVLRVLLFYVGSIFVIVTVLPWNAPGVATSPYATALKSMGLHGADALITVVILFAVLSCLNSGLFTSSRILFALTRNGHAPKWLAALSSNGVPRRAILAGTSFGYVAVIMAAVSPTHVFSFLVDSYGAIALFIYVIVAVTELKLRARLEKEAPERLVLKMWGYPYLSWFTILAMLGVVVGTAFDTPREAAFSGLGILIVLGAYQVKRFADWRASSGQPPGTSLFSDTANPEKKALPLPGAATH